MNIIIYFTDNFNEINFANYYYCRRYEHKKKLSKISMCREISVKKSTIKYNLKHLYLSNENKEKRYRKTKVEKRKQ